MRERIPVDGTYVEAEVEIIKGSKTNVILLHGSNNDMDSSLITKLYSALKGKVSVLRFNFSYIGGKRAPDEKKDKEELEACIRYMGGKDIVLAGKSWGGYIATLEASENRSVRKVIVLGYPLHESGRPDKVSPQGHLTGKRLPVEFIIGDSDRIGHLDAFEKALSGYKVHLIKDADHSFKNPKTGDREKGEDEAVSVAISLIV